MNNLRRTTPPIAKSTRKDKQLASLQLQSICLIGEQSANYKDVETILIPPIHSFRGVYAHAIPLRHPCWCRSRRAFHVSPFL